MKTLKEMNLYELKQLQNEWIELYQKHLCEDFRQNALEVEREYLSRCITEIEQTHKISVFFEHGYKWSVHVEGEEESRITGLNKVDAMDYAKHLKKTIFRNKAIIEAQKMSKKEKSENMKYLHGHTETYERNLRI